MKFVPNKVARSGLWCLCVLCLSAVHGFTLDREAFSIQRYDLEVRVEPEQHRLAARGKITLRNDTAAPQKIAVLQVSSSLDWRAIRAADKPVQFVTQPLTSDVDHTGRLSEAIVTLPEAVPPHGTVDLDIGYEGVILLDATRLTRIGAPEDSAKSTDWDQIDSSFTGVRGIGHVAWYPIATDVANLSEAESLFATLERWKAREAGATARLKINLTEENLESGAILVVDEPTCFRWTQLMSRRTFSQADCTFREPGEIVPSFAIAQFGAVDRKSITVLNLPSHAAAGEIYADAAEKIAPWIADWFGAPREKSLLVDVPDPAAAPFESGSFLMTPLASADPKLVGLMAAHQLTHAAFLSPRAWINEGLAHFAQALYLEQDKGRATALDYLAAHRSGLRAMETGDEAARSQAESEQSLVNSTSEELIRSKALSVWWMLRDMVGDAALKKAIAAYKPEEDKNPSYMPGLISAQTQRDLGWFFDDWVLHDHGLPNFKVESAFARSASPTLFVLTITVENTGTAGAEVPVIIRMAKGESVKRVEVRAKGKATVRVETPAAPLELVVNDGSVPESETKDNVFKVAAPGGS